MTRKPLLFPLGVVPALFACSFPAGRMLEDGASDVGGSTHISTASTVGTSKGGTTVSSTGAGTSVGASSSSAGGGATGTNAGASSTAGASATGGMATAVGTSSVGGAMPTSGGASNLSSNASGGFSTAAGNSGLGGTLPASGGATSANTIATGGIEAIGGATGVGGATNASTAATGGILVTGGASAGGGDAATGGVNATGGATVNAGGAATGGAAAGGAATGGNAAGGAATGGAATGGAATGGAATGGFSGVTVQLAQTEQLIEGFGLSDTWQTIPAGKVDTFFSATTGIGMTILRTAMASNGAAMNANESASIDAVTTAAGSEAKIIGTVFSAPASCKTLGTTQDGHLKASCYESWATTIANWEPSSSTPLYAMSIANEPDFVSCGMAEPCYGNYESTAFTANELVEFLKVAAPKLQAKGVKIIAPEVSQWNRLWSNGTAGPDVNGVYSTDPLACGCHGMSLTVSGCASACLSGDGYDYGHYLAADQEAWAAFDIIGVHQYYSQQGYAWPSDVTAAKKDVWVTEMAGLKWWPEQGYVGGGGVLTGTSSIENGVAVAGWIHSALVIGNASAWLWWWYQATGTDDNGGIYLRSGADTKRHYTIGNYSKFVRPGYHRVDVTNNSNADLLISAYTGSNTVVVVAINKGSTDVTIPISIAGGTVPPSCTPYVTSAADDLVGKSPVSLVGGAFSASLPKTTVTTFVCT